MKKQVYNPYLPSYEYIPDGEPRVFNERLYIFGSHDRYGSDFFCQNDYVTWSAPIDDLSDWKYHGLIFDRYQDSLNKEGFVLFAPDVIQGNDGRYYLYYAPCGTCSIGVAVSQRPQGPYKFLGHITHKDETLYGRKENDPYPFDPAIFIDDDKRIYLFAGFDPDPGWDYLEREFGKTKLSHKPCYVELEEDMYTIKGGPYPLKIENCPDHGHQFFEASSMRKFEGRYYFIYSSWNSHELAYAISDKVQGPYQYKGILHDNGDIGIVEEKDRVSYTGNNHGSLIQIKGKYYIFGHRQTDYSSYSRQGIAEEIRREADGTFRQAEMTSCGLNGGSLLPSGRYGAYIACHLTAKSGAIHYLDMCPQEIREKHPAFVQEGQDRENDPKQYITNMQDGSTCGFKYFAFEKEIFLSVSTRGDSGIIEVRTSFKGPVLATIRIEENKDFTDSKKVRLSIEETDRFALYLTYKGEGHIDLLEFELS